LIFSFQNFKTSITPQCIGCPAGRFFPRLLKRL
jgi:hypothetical protein